jgi:hypothetical protein
MLKVKAVIVYGRLMRYIIKNYIMKKILFILTLNSSPYRTRQNNTEEIKIEKQKIIF